MFYKNEKGQRVFKGGKEDYLSALKEAKICPIFKLDVEEELVSDEERSCYNCRFRRWTKDSFICAKGD